MKLYGQLIGMRRALNSEILAVKFFKRFRLVLQDCVTEINF